MLIPLCRLLSCSIVLLAAVPRAQGALENVIPGRMFERQKLLSPGLTDVWKVEVAADEMLHCVIATSAFDPILEFVDAEGRVLQSNDGEGTRSELWLRAPTAGPMAFQVKPFRGSGGGQYSFQLSRFTTQPLAQHGEATAEFAEAVEAASRNATEAIETMQVAPEHKSVVQGWFGRLEAKAKGKPAQPTPAGEKK